jgi:hypothetical protein
MKINFLAIVAVTAVSFLTTTNGSAQTNYQAGITLGSNYSSVRSDVFTTTSGRLGVAAGASFVIGFGDRFELNHDVVFTQKGATAKAVRFMPEQKVDIAEYAYYYNTVEVGLLAGYQPIRELPVRVQAGGFFGTHFHTLDRTQDDLWVGNYQNEQGATPAIKLNNAFSGLDFGPAVGVSVGSGRFRTHFRYQHGVKNMYNNLDYVAAGPRIRSSSVRLSLTYFLK